MVTLTWHACKYKVHKLHQRYILCIKVQCFLPQSISHIETLTYYEDNKVFFLSYQKEYYILLECLGKQEGFEAGSELKPCWDTSESGWQ